MAAKTALDPLKTEAPKAEEPKAPTSMRALRKTPEYQANLKVKRDREEAEAKAAELARIAAGKAKTEAVAKD